MNNNRSYFTISLYAFFGALFVVLFTACVYRFSDVLSVLKSLWNAIKPVVYGILIALSMNPIYATLHDRIFRFTERKKPHPHLRKTLSLLVTYVILLAVLLALVAAVLPQLISSCEEIAVKSTAYLSAALNWLDARLHAFSIPNFLLSTSNPVEGGDLSELDTLSVEEYVHAFRYGARSTLQEARVKLSLLLSDRFIRVDISQSIQNFIDRAIDSLTAMIPTLLGSFNRILTEMKNFLLGLVISIYFLVAKERMRALTAKLMHTVFGDRINQGLRSFGRATYLVFVEFMTGKLLDAVIVMYLSYIVLMLLGLPYPILLSSIIGMTNLIPFLGPIVGGAVCGCIVFVFAPSKTLLFLLLILLIQQLDLHLLEPHIIGPKQYLSNFWILISVVIMGRAFGIVGCFLAVPTFAVIGILLDGWQQRRLQKIEASEQRTEQEPLHEP